MLITKPFLTNVQVPFWAACRPAACAKHAQTLGSLHHGLRRIFRALIKAAHLSVSALSSAAISSGVLARGSAPDCNKRLATAGSANALRVAKLSASTIGRGVFEDTKKAYQLLVSIAGKPISPKVRTSGKPG